MARPPSSQPTDGEMEILKVLWEDGACGLHAICEALRRERPVATTTVATRLKIMLEKRLVRRQDGEKGYLWSAALSRKAATTGMLGKLLDHVFEGSAARLVTHLIESDRLSDRDRRTIQRLLRDADEADGQHPQPRNAGNA